jgi:hypothetical protein
VQDAENPPKLVHEAIITTPDGERFRLVASNSSQIESVAGQVASLDEAMASDQPVPSLASTAQSLHELVVAAVDELCALLSGHDAFDVMTMLRQYLVPPDLSHWRESETKVEGSWACAEIVALALLGMGLPTRSASNSKRTAEIIPEVVARAAHLLQLSDIDAVGALAGGQHSELSRVAWMLCTYETNVRGRQYTSIADRINDALLRRPRAAEIWTNELGYNLDDVLQVRAAIATICGSAHRANLDQLQRLAEIDPAEIDEIGRQAVITLIETPSDLYTLTVDQVAHQSGISVTTVRAILNLFSIAANGGTTQELVMSLIKGRNPMAGKAILRRDNSYLVLPGAISLGEIRRICESQLKRRPSWTSYDRQRKAGSEELTAKAIGQLTHGYGQSWPNLEYHAPTSNNPGVDLSAQSTNVRRRRTGRVGPPPCPRWSRTLRGSQSRRCSISDSTGWPPRANRGPQEDHQGSSRSS